MGVKLKLIDSPNPDGKEKGGQGPDKSAQAVGTGQALSVEQVSDLAAQIGASIAGAIQGNIGNPDPKPAAPLYSQLGITDGDAVKMKESMGEDAFARVMETMHSVASKAQSNDVLIAQELKDMTAVITAKIDAQNKQLKEFGKGRDNTDQMWQMYGLTDVFTEQNKPDLKEYLDGVSAQAGGLFDAVSAFERGQEENNYVFLNDVKGGFEAFLQEKYKDHAGVSGGDGRVNREGLKQQNEAEQKIVDLEEKREAARKAGKPAEALGFNEEIKVLASQM